MLRKSKILRILKGEGQFFPFLGVTDRGFSGDPPLHNSGFVIQEPQSPCVRDGLESGLSGLSSFQPN
jgi:hypothetical protein